MATITEPTELTAEERLWQALAAIPKGSLLTYGQLATASGFPGRARWAGQMLSRLPADTKLPWHRVINASGSISFPPESTSFERQRKKLISEGFEISAKGKVTARNK
ncbi:MAG: MGMT family protein [Thalassolituus sp.]